LTQYLLHKYPVFIFLVILCTVMWISLSLFFLYHMYLVKLGFTTNEKVKKSCLEDDVETAIRKHLRAIADLKDISTEEKKAQYIDLKESYSELREREKKIKSINYSKGFWNNLKTIIMA
jgi:hypothetical protein